jgi:hypothetical protein
MSEDEFPIIAVCFISLITAIKLYKNVTFITFKKLRP